MTLAGMDSDFKASTGFAAQDKDQLLVSNSTDGTFIYTRTSTAWTNTTRLRVHGDAIVQGTLAVNKLADGSMAIPGGMFGLGSGSGAIMLGDSYGGATTYTGSVYGRGIDANKVGGFFLSEKGIGLIAATAGTNMPAITGHSRANANFTGNLTAGYLGIHDRGGSFVYWGNATHAKTGAGLALANEAGIFSYNDVTINKVQRLAHLATSTESGKFVYFSNATTTATVITSALLATATHGGYFTGGVGPFTGCHDALIEHTELGTIEPGDIVCDSIVYARAGLTDTITIAVASKSPNEKNAVGIYHRQGDYTPAALVAAEDYDHDTYQLITIASVGEGQINVTGENGNLEPGDLITSSSIRGKGMRQADDIVRSYTVAKCRETVVFDSPDQVKQVACIYMCG